MLKYAAMLAFSFLLFPRAYAQDVSAGGAGLANIDACSSIMSAADLMKSAEKMRKSKDENDQFFAANCVMLAAHKGDAEAQYRLSRLYEQGVGVPISVVYAYKWAKIADLNGRKINKNEFEKMETEMNINDFRQASTEISEFLNFEKRLESIRERSPIPSALMNRSYADLTEEQIAAIEKSKRDIDDLFRINSIDGAEKTAEELRGNIQGREFNREREQMERQRMEIAKERARMKEENERTRRMMQQQDQQRRNQSIGAQQQQPAAAAAQSGTGKSGGKQRKTADFYTDKYNPRFTPPK